MSQEAGEHLDITWTASTKVAKSVTEYADMLFPGDSLRLQFNGFQVVITQTGKGMNTSIIDTSGG